MNRKLTPLRIRKMRRALGMSKEDFGRVLWAALTTVEQWESGECAPVGMHYQLLVLIEKSLENRSIRAALRDARTSDPLLLLYRLLEPIYGTHSR